MRIMREGSMGRLIRNASYFVCKRALLFALAITATTAWSDDNSGGLTSGTYYVKHVSSGKYIAAGHNWDTRGIVNGGGLDMTLTVTDNGGIYSVTFGSRIGSSANKALGYNLFIDSEAYSFTVQSTDGGYTIGDGSDSYLHVDGNDEIQWGISADVWQFVSKADRIASFSNATVANPMDATFLMPGANFGRNDPRVESWVISDNCTNYKFGGDLNESGKANRCTESYHSPFDIYQTISDAPAGTYALNVQGFYRNDGSGSDVPVFYVGTSSTSVPILTGTENSMSLASQAFQAGNYRLEKPVLFYYDGSEGGFNVGVKCDSNDKWVIFDNFQLEYLGAANVNPIFVNGMTATYSNSELEGKQITIKNGGKISVTGVTLDFTDTDEIELFGTTGLSVEGSVLPDGADLRSIILVDGTTIQYVPFLSDGKVVVRHKVIDDGFYYVQEISSGKCMVAGYDYYGTRGAVNTVGMELKLTVTEGLNGVIFDSYPASSIDNHYLGAELYMDQAKCVFTLAKTEQGLTISRNGQYVYVDDNSKLAFGDTPSYWTLVPTEQRMNSLSAAGKNNGVNATFLIKNSSFEQSEARFAKAWTVTADNNNLRGGNENNRCAESYKSSNGINLSQTLSGAPAGTYALTAQGFYRIDGTDSGVLPKFFLGAATAAFPLRTGTENSMSQASTSFSAGKYTIAPIYFYYDGTGDLTLGVSYGYDDKWIIFDNFQLTYYGPDDVAPPTPGKYYIQYAEEGDYNGKFMAAGNSWGTRGIVNVTGLDFTLANMNGARTVSLDSNVSNGGEKHYLGGECFVDSLPTGFAIDPVEDGCHTIMYGEKYLTVVNGQLELADTAAKWRFITPADRKESLSAATKAAPLNATFLIPGANFGRNDGRVSSWTGSYTAGGDNTNYCADNNEIAFDLYQTITDVPAGLYALTAQGFYSGSGDNVPVFYIGDATIDFTARADADANITDKAKASASFIAGNYLTGPLFYYYDGNAEGFKVGAKYTETDKWVVFDNFQLNYMGQVVACDANGEYYSVLADALSAAQTAGGGTITLLADVTGDVEIPATGITLALGDHTISGNVTGARFVGVSYDDATKTYTSSANNSATWVGGASGSWLDPANWSTRSVPTWDTDVIVGNDCTIYISDNGWDNNGAMRDMCKNLTVDANVSMKYSETPAWCYLVLYGDISGSGKLTLTWVGIDGLHSPKTTIGCELKLNSAWDSQYSIWRDVCLLHRDGIEYEMTKSVEVGENGVFNVFGDTSITGNITLENSASLYAGEGSALSVKDIIVADGATVYLSCHATGASATVSGTVTAATTDSYYISSSSTDTRTTYVSSAKSTIAPGVDSESYATVEAATDALDTYKVALSASQIEQGLETSYYELVAEKGNDEKYYIRAVLAADEVAPSVSTDTTINVSQISFGMSDLKKGLYYRVATRDFNGNETRGSWSECYDGTNAPTLTSDLPSDGARLYTIEASDSND